MAGYVIHLAVAEEYIRKHENEIDNYKDFINGIIFPDSVENKSLTHYGEKSSKVHLDKFLKENDISSSYNKGYFLHLITDYLFYNKFLEYYSTDIYNDYDILNKSLIEKYNVKLPNAVKDKVFYTEGETKILDLKDTQDFIENTSSYNISDIKEDVLKGDKFWTTIKILKKT